MAESSQFISTFWLLIFARLIHWVVRAARINLKNNKPGACSHLPCTCTKMARASTNTSSAGGMTDSDRAHHLHKLSLRAARGFWISSGCSLVLYPRRLRPDPRGFQHDCNIHYPCLLIIIMIRYLIILLFCYSVWKFEKSYRREL